MTDGQTGQEIYGFTSTKRAQIPVRTTAENRDRLIAAAKAADRSLTQEIEQRLEDSFTAEDRAGSPATRRLLTMLAAEIGLVEGHTGKGWREDVATWAAVRVRIRARFDEERPPFVNGDTILKLSHEMETLNIRIEALCDYLLDVGAIKKKEEKPSALMELLAGINTLRPPPPSHAGAPRKRAGMFGSSGLPGLLNQTAMDESRSSEPEQEASPLPAMSSDHAFLVAALAANGFEIAIDIDDRTSWNLTAQSGSPVPPTDYDGIMATFGLVRKFNDDRLTAGAALLAAFHEDEKEIKAGEEIALQITEQVNAHRAAMKAREGQQ